MRLTFPAVLLGGVLFLSSLSTKAQSPQLVTRYDFYTGENDAALILYGVSPDSVKALYGPLEKALEITRRRPDCLLARLPITALPQGESRQQIRIEMTDGRRLSQPVLIKKLSPRPYAVKVDRLTGGLLVDDQPFYPMGFYTGFPVGDVPVQEAYNAMNLMGVYQRIDEETLEERQTYMDRCAALGIKVNYHLNSLVGTPHNQTQVEITEAEQQRREALLREEVRRFRDHPALLSWYMNDEPVGQGRSPELLERAYQIIKEEDPYHPVSVVFVIPSRAAAYADALDIAMTDPYPVPGDVREVRRLMQELTEAFLFQKAIWLVPQAFGGGEFWSREPTADEIRIMTYLGILDGAMGIKYFIRRRPHYFPKSRVAWNAAVRIAHEMLMLSPWLFGESGRRPLNGSDRDIVAAAWEGPHSTLIIAANTDRRPRPFSLPLEGIDRQESARVLFENREVDIKNDRLPDILDGYGVKLYELPKEKSVDADPLDSHNLFINPGFEYCYSPGTPYGCYAGSRQQPGYDGATFFVDAGYAHSGAYALKLNLPYDSSHLSLNFLKMQLQPRHRYQGSLWARTGPHQKTMTFSLTLSGREEQYTFSAGPEWRRFDFSFEAGEQLTVSGLGIEAEGEGTLWIDDIAVYPDPVIEVSVDGGPEAEVALQTASEDAKLYYRLSPNARFLPYDKPFTVDQYTELDLSLRQNGQEIHRLKHVIPLSKATGKPVHFQVPYSEKYQAQGGQSIVDGAYGSLAFRDNNWLGWAGKDVEFTVDLEEVMTVREATAHFLVSIDDGIHAPESMSVEYSLDGEQFQLFGKTENTKGSRHGDPYMMELQMESAPLRARYLRYRIESPKIIPPGYLFSGTDAWVFIDEIRVE